MGAIGSFFISRLLLRSFLKEIWKDNTKFLAIERAIEKHGFKLCLLLRLSPIIPFNVLNYLIGATSVALKDNIIGLIGMIPEVAFYVYIGSTLSDLN